MNISGNSDEMEKLPLPPSMQQVESVIASTNAIFSITKYAALKLYGEYLDTLIPNALTNWYLSNYQSIIEVF